MRLSIGGCRSVTVLLIALKQGDREPNRDRRAVAGCARDVERAATDLRTFTHPDTGQVDLVDVSEAVASALRFLSNEWRDRVQMDVRLPKGQAVRANKNRLVQVLLNLLQNALDAMKNKSFVNELPRVQISGHVTREKSIILIHDNGEGIDPQHLDKVFDPFFTTKAVGDGMGLGLSICYRLVGEHGGQIVVKSERGQFTEFRLEFPATELN
jgi:signal transduction histidine kinase